MDIRYDMIHWSQKIDVLSAAAFFEVAIPHARLEKKSVLTTTYWFPVDALSNGKRIFMETTYTGTLGETRFTYRVNVYLPSGMLILGKQLGVSIHRWHSWCVSLCLWAVNFASHGVVHAKI